MLSQGSALFRREAQVLSGCLSLERTITAIVDGLSDADRNRRGSRFAPDYRMAPPQLTFLLGR
jgi:hypothetical protein